MVDSDSLASTSSNFSFLGCVWQLHHNTTIGLYYTPPTHTPLFCTLAVKTCHNTYIHYQKMAFPAIPLLTKHAPPHTPNKLVGVMLGCCMARRAVQWSLFTKHQGSNSQSTPAWVPQNYLHSQEQVRYVHGRDINTFMTGQFRAGVMYPTCIACLKPSSIRWLLCSAISFIVEPKLDSTAAPNHHNIRLSETCILRHPFPPALCHIVPHLCRPQWTSHPYPSCHAHAPPPAHRRPPTNLHHRTNLAY